jgi:hypothetical protein
VDIEKNQIVKKREEKTKRKQNAKLENLTKE